MLPVQIVRQQPARRRGHPSIPTIALPIAARASAVAPYWLLRQEGEYIDANGAADQTQEAFFLKTPHYSYHWSFMCMSMLYPSLPLADMIII